VPEAHAKCDYEKQHSYSSLDAKRKLNQQNIVCVLPVLDVFASQNSRELDVLTQQKRGDTTIQAHVTVSQHMEASQK
jgi:hypothetical protein